MGYSVASGAPAADDEKSDPFKRKRALKDSRREKTTLENGLEGSCAGDQPNDRPARWYSIPVIHFPPHSSWRSPSNFTPITSLVKVQIKFYWIILPRNSISPDEAADATSSSRVVSGAEVDINNLIFSPTKI